MKIALPIRYGIFAAIAATANLLTQNLTLLLNIQPYPIYVSIFIGTLVGLFIKYQLDKYFIFQFRTLNPLHEGRTFTLYSLMGVITTLLFWSIELGFYYAFKSDTMRYIGGAIGLSIGYFIKYKLDKIYVFN
jgi:putative flippase GtrA